MYVDKLQRLAAEAGLFFDDLSVRPRDETWPLVSLSGALVDFQGPKQLGSGLATSDILLQGGGIRGGWQSVPKGHGLWLMAPIEGTLEAVASLKDLLVVFVKVNQHPQEGSQHLLVCQGPWHDLCSFDFDDLGEAISELSILAPSDSARGFSLALPKDTAILQEEMVVSLDPFIVSISDRAMADVPGWPGTSGRYAEFFAFGGVDAKGVIAISDDAFGFIAPVDPDDTAPLESFEKDLVDQVRVSWRR